MTRQRYVTEFGMGHGCPRLGHDQSGLPGGFGCHPPLEFEFFQGAGADPRTIWKSMC